MVLLLTTAAAGPALAFHEFVSILTLRTVKAMIAGLRCWDAASRGFSWCSRGFFGSLLVLLLVVALHQPNPFSCIPSSTTVCLVEGFLTGSLNIRTELFYNRRNHFLPMDGTEGLNTIKGFRFQLSLANDNKNAHGGNPSEDETETVQAYGNRSLAWTKRYRKHFPYEYARKEAMSLGLRSKDEWDEYLADGKVYHGAYLPNRPDEMYALEWISWEEFLGIMRSYDEAKDLVQNVLKLRNMGEYIDFVSANTKRAEGLRIPAKPHIVYKGKGWISPEDFFGVDFQ